MQEADLTLDSDYADPNPFALTFWVLQAGLLRLLLLLERLRQRRKLAVEVLEEEPLLNYFGHVEFIEQPLRSAEIHSRPTALRQSTRSRWRSAPSL
jgi:hypothetical protein